jgi:large subunit ribosomal protein L15
MPHKLRKSRKQRGSRYCGWGQVGQHRGGGMRGGKGKAGGRKHLWIQTVKYYPDRYKKVGFKPPSSLEPEAETVNVGELKDLAVKILGADKVNGGADELSLDLESLGYGKLLGRGHVDLPLHITVPEYTSKALEKVEAAGGQILESE